MPQPLPVIGGRDARRASERPGLTFDRQRGSHVILTKPGEPAPGLIRAAGLTVDEFVAALD